MFAAMHAHRQGVFDQAEALKVRIDEARTADDMKAVLDEMGA